MTLRDYQQETVDKAIEWIKARKDSAILDLATGAGKSHIIAALAHWFNSKTGLKVLCLAPSQELVSQNHKKYLLSGSPASIYCASLNKSLAHNVVFGSPRTVLNAIDKFCENFALIIIDEAHGITPTIKNIIEKLKAKQKNLRVIGLSATPYRLGDGYIYAYDETGNPVSDGTTRDPYFHQLIHRVSAKYLIGRGFLTRPVTSKTVEHYDTSHLKLVGDKFDAKQVEQTFEGRGRLTSVIVQDIVENSTYCMGVIIFAATVAHAKEVLESLPVGISAMIVGGTKDRNGIIEKFKKMEIKYLVNVGVLTTGFDAEHIDHVAIMRATESIALLQQIIGRGLRIHKNKRECLVSDYAGNIERHCPDGDIFTPTIKASYKGESEPLEVECPSCRSINFFSARKNKDNFKIDKNGYFIDLAGSRIIDQETGQEYPAHYGRRCMGQIIENKKAQRCEYKWSFKACFSCGHQNDIAARYCEKCKEEIIDPNEKLSLEKQKIKDDPYSVSTDKVLSWRVRSWTSKSGNETLKIDYTTECATFPVWYSPHSNSHKTKFLWKNLCAATLDEIAGSIEEYLEKVNLFLAEMPKTITVRKNRETKFYEVFGHNLEADQ